MNGTELILFCMVITLAMFIAFLVGGAMGVRTNEETKKNMTCSKCGHKG